VNPFTPVGYSYKSFVEHCEDEVKYVSAPSQVIIRVTACTE